MRIKVPLKDFSGLSPGRPRISGTELSAKSGLPPGSLVHVGKVQPGDVSISVIDYDENGVHLKDSADVDHLRSTESAGTTRWIDVNGLHQVETIAQIGWQFGLHPLILEDVLNTNQRPKIEEAGDSLFIVLKVVHYDEDAEEIDTEQLSLVLGPHFLLTFREASSPLFEGLRESIVEGRGRIRNEGADYLVSCLIDVVVDKYFEILDKLAVRIEQVEEELGVGPRRETIRDIHELRTDMIVLRRSLWPLRDVIGKLAKGDKPVIRDSTLPYLRDVHDHAIHVVETLDTYRELVTGIHDIYLSTTGNKLNEIMTVLAIIGTIFIPLTFLTGWYGMNFKAMPELASPWGYPGAIIIALASTVVMLIFFRWKKWI